MAFNIKILKSAYKDLQEATKWYNEQLNNLGKEFRIEVNKELDYISNNPYYYQLKYKEYRQALVNRFPYLIYYLVVENTNEIIVFGIIHTKRNPRTIKRRIT